MDLNSTFSNGLIEETIYVKQPDRFVQKGKEGHVMRLIKALYGLKQAPRAWYVKLDSCLSSFSFRRSSCEYVVYVRVAEGENLLVGVYVDNLIMNGARKSHIFHFKNQIKEFFEMTDLGHLSSYLGIEVSQRKDRIISSQRAYALKILEESDMMEANATHTLKEERVVFRQTSRRDEEDPTKMINSTEYKSLIGKVRYLTHTHPDLQYAIGIMSKYMEKPFVNHMVGMKRILRYIRGIVDLVLFYEKGQVQADLVGYSDSDHVGDEDDRRSTTGIIFFLRSMAISWNSQKQPIVTLSSCESEYVAVNSAATQGIWLSQMIGELKGEAPKPFKILVDNKSTISLSKNHFFHNRSKHIKKRFDYI